MSSGIPRKLEYGKSRGRTKLPVTSHFNSTLNLSLRLLSSRDLTTPSGKKVSGQKLY